MKHKAEVILALKALAAEQKRIAKALERYAQYLELKA
jgi:hypothetical protein